MEKFIVSGPKQLHGDITVAGAKNVALKALVASLLTDDELIIHNIPHIRDVHLMVEVLQSLGRRSAFTGSTITIHKTNGNSTTKVPLEIGARLRASSMVLGPLLARFGSAQIPNPGGCRIGARPIDRHIDGLKSMGASVEYHSEDGYFYAKADTLNATTFTFPKNTHTGTETLLLAAVLAHGTTILKNAAEEIEVDDLIALLNAMGARISRTGTREITIEGVASVHGATFTIMPDRNEEVTFAIAAVASKGSITVHASQRKYIQSFLDIFTESGGKYECIDDTTTRYYYDVPLHGVEIVTLPHPGFMTDWQAPWALLMTQAQGVSTIHETVFESRFSYVEELKKMGAHITFVDPKIENPHEFYNFNWDEREEKEAQAIEIHGPTDLHNAIVVINDLRAGATILLAAIIAEGVSTIFGIEQIDRGYEHIEDRLKKLGADITRIIETDVS